MLKKYIPVLIFCLLAATVMSGCAGNDNTTSAPAEPSTTTAEPATTTPEPTAPAPTVTEPDATEPAVTEPATSEPATEPPAPVLYDAASRTYLVSAADDYESLTFPAADDAAFLQLENAEFTVIASLNLLRKNGIDGSDGLAAFLARCNNSLAFLRTYLRENLGEDCPAAAALPVKWQFKSSVEEGIKKNSERITLNSQRDLTHREFYYLIALMEKGNTGWEQLGYAWYVSSCLDPNSELQRIAIWDPASDDFYDPILRGAGLDSAVLSPAQFRTYYDAVARYCFEHGIGRWGAICESSPVTAEPVYSRAGSHKVNSGDDTLSAFMSASFVAWLDEHYGAAPLSRFVFGQCTFDEAFGTDFDTAFGSWKAWILEHYPLP